MAALVFSSFIFGLKIKSRVLSVTLALEFPPLQSAVKFVLFKALQMIAYESEQFAPLSSSLLFANVAFTQECVFFSEIGTRDGKVKLLTIVLYPSK